MPKDEDMAAWLSEATVCMKNAQTMADAGHYNTARGWLKDAIESLRFAYKDAESNPSPLSEEG